jgi:predicted small secreted protein
MKKGVWLPVLVAVAVLTAGCNTMRGAGQDIERGGEKIQQKAR